MDAPPPWTLFPVVSRWDNVGLAWPVYKTFGLYQRLPAKKGRNKRWWDGFYMILYFSFQDFPSLSSKFKEFLGLASAAKLMVIFLDSVDQLSYSHNAHGLSWLPRVLPDHVRLIVSTLDGDHLECFQVLKVCTPKPPGVGHNSQGVRLQKTYGSDIEISTSFVWGFENI